MQDQWSAHSPGWAGFPAHWLGLLAWAMSPPSFSKRVWLSVTMTVLPLALSSQKAMGATYLSLCAQRPRQCVHYSVNKRLSNYQILSSVLGARHRAGNEVEEVLAVMEVTFMCVYGGAAGGTTSRTNNIMKT